VERISAHYSGSSFIPKVSKVVLLTFIFGCVSSCRVNSTTASMVTNSTPTIEVVPQPAVSSPSPTHISPTDTSVPPTPTDTPVPPAPTQTLAPTSLNATGPYVMFEARNGIWISNPDGGFPTQLIKNDIWSILDLHRHVSPTGDRMAMVISNDAGLDLQIIKIPSGETQTIAHLIDSPPAGNYDPTSANSFATYAIRDYESVAWQPGDGRLLAFIGAINGPTADLYLYDTQTGEITQLTDGPSQAVLPVWSPDGKYILHFGVSWVPPFGGAIIGANRFDGVWVVQASDGKVITLPKNEGTVPHFVGWQDDSHYITYDDDECSANNLRSVDVVSGKTTPIMNTGFYYYIDRSPENGALLLSSASGCANSLGEGIFLLTSGQTVPTKINDKRAWEIDWMPESKLFNAYPEGLYSSDGQTFYEPPAYDKSYKPAVSKDGFQAWEVIENQKGRVVVRVPNGDWQIILNGSVSELIWDPVDAKTLLIALNDGSIYSAAYPDFSPRLMGNLGDGVNQIIWSP
jgi:Tol biopolymer transport system component